MSSRNIRRLTKRLLLAAWAYLYLADVAHAEPLTLALFGAAFASSFGGAIVSALFGTAAVTVVDWLFNFFGGNDSTKKKTPTEVQFGERIARQGTFGTDNVGGHLVHYNEYSNAKHLQIVHILADAWCEGLDTVYIDNRQYVLSEISNTGNGETHAYHVLGWGVGVSTPSDSPTDKYGSNIVLRFHNGHPGQSVDADLVAQTPGWDSHRKYEGMCYVVADILSDKTMFSGIPELGYALKGMRCWDPRADTTMGGSGSQRYADPTTWVYSENPGVQAYHFLRGFMLDGRRILGAAVPAADLNFNSFVDFMNICDETVSIPGGGTRPRYRSHLTFKDTDTFGDVLRRMCEAAAGFYTEQQGRISIFAGKAQSSVLTITDDDLTEDDPVNFDPKLSKDALFTGIQGTYTHSTDFLPVPYTAIIPSTFATEDNKEKIQDFNVPEIHHPHQAFLVAKIKLFRTRLQASAQIFLDLKDLLLEVGDWLVWNSANSLRGNRTYQVMGCGLNLKTLRMQLVLREISTAVFSDTSTVGDIAETTRVPNIGGYQRLVTSLAAHAVAIPGSADFQIPALHVTYDPAIDPAISRVLIQYRQKTPAGAINKDYDPSPGDGGVYLANNVVSGIRYEVQAQFISKTGRVAVMSAWVTADNDTPSLVGTPGAGTVSITAFASGIAAPQVVSSLGSAIAAEGNLAVLTTDGRLYRYHSGAWVIEVPANVLSGQIVTAQISTAAVTANELASAAVTNVKLAALAVATANIQVAAVTSSIIANNAVQTANIAALAVTASEVAASAITTAKIAAGAVDAGALASSAVTNAKIASAAIDASKITSGLSFVEYLSALPATGNYQGRMVFLTSDNKLYRHTGSPTNASGFIATVGAADVTGTLTNVQIADLAATKITGQLVTAQISDTAITTAKIALLAVDSTILASNAVVTAKINAAAITTAKIASGAVTTTEIASLTIAAGNIASAAVTTAKIALAAIDSTLIANNAVVSAAINSLAVTTAKIAAAAVTTTEIAANTIVAANIAAATITATQIAAATITGAKIAAGTITATNLVAGTITANEIAAGTITGDRLVANSITARELIIADFSNMVPDPEFLNHGNTWVDSIGVNFASITWPTNSGSTSGGAYVQIPAGLINAASVNVAAGKSPVFPVNPATQYAVGATVALLTGATGTMNADILWYTNTLVFISATTIGSQATVGATNANAIVTPPATAVFASMRFWRGATGANTASVGIGQYYNEYFRKATSASLIVDGTITAAKIVSGTITSNEIAANTITAADIAAGTITTNEIAALTIVAGNIAATTITAAKIVSGTITTAQIAATTIVAGNIASGTITTTQIAASTIVAGNIAALAITGAQIAAGAITAAKIAAGTITSNEIAANTIVAGDIAAGTITGSLIAANAITARELLIADFSNIVPDSDFNALASVWNHDVVGANWAQFFVGTGSTATRAGRYLQLPAGLINPSSTNLAGLTHDSVPVEPGEVYAAGGIVAMGAGATGTAYLDMQWLTAAGASISITTVGVVSTVASTQFDVTATAPSNAAFVRLRCVATTPLANTTSVGIRQWYNLYLRKAYDSQLIVDGAIITAKLASGAVTAAKITAGTITATQIASGTITSNEIAANTITASDIAAGTITTSQIASTTIVAGNIAATTITSTQMAANSITTTQLAAGAVTAAKITAGTITSNEIAAATITGANIVSGTITARELILTDFRNLVPNGDFEVQDYASYFTTAGFTPTFVSGNANYVRTGTNAIVLDKATNATLANFTMRNAFPVEGGKDYYFESTSWTNVGVGGAAGFNPRVQWFDVSGTLISTDNVVASGNIDSTYRVWSNTLTAPSTARSAKVLIFSLTTASTTRLVVDHLIVRKKDAATLIVDGGITANQIAANTITAGQIAANTLTAATIAVGAIGVSELAANAVTATAIAANAITAGKINAGAISTSSLMVDGVVITAKINDHAVTTPNLLHDGTGGIIPSAISGGSYGNSLAANTWYILAHWVNTTTTPTNQMVETVTATDNGVIVSGNITLSSTPGGTNVKCGILYKNGSTYIPLIVGGDQGAISGALLKCGGIDVPGAGSATYALAIMHDHTSSGVNLNYSDASLSANVINK